MGAFGQRLGYAFIITGLLFIVIPLIIRIRVKKKNPSSMNDIIHPENAKFLMFPSIIVKQDNRIIIKGDKTFYYGAIVLFFIFAIIILYVFFPRDFDFTLTSVFSSSIILFIIPILILALISIILISIAKIIKEDRMFIFQKDLEYFIFTVKYNDSDDIINLNENVVKIPIENLINSFIDTSENTYWNVLIKNALGGYSIIKKTF
ncbi:MAG: hypothetical protein ACTSVX_09185 [Promethearchaeota archaeon]